MSEQRLVRPELLAADRRRGQWDLHNDEGNCKGPMRHDEAVYRVNQYADKGGVAEIYPPTPLMRRASQYVKRLRRMRQKDRAVRREHIDLAVDANGERYTTHTFAQNGDPWRGATILTPSVVRSLRERDLLPLTEVTEGPDHA